MSTVKSNVELQEVAAEEHEEVTEQLGLIANEEDHNQSRIQAIKQNPWPFAWCMFAVWTTLLVSYENQASGNVLGIPQFRKDFGYEYEGSYVLSPNWQSAFSGGPVATTIIGALGSGWVSDKIGRRITIMAALTLSIVAVTIEVIATTDVVFFIGKLINGICVGALASVCSTYVGEVAPLALRGLLTVLLAFTYNVGPFICALIVNSTGTATTRWAYRAVFVSQYGFAVFSAIFIFWMPESPWWLISKGREPAAIKSLQRLGYAQTSEDAQKRLAVIKLTLEKIRQETENVSYAECFRKSNLRRTIISVMPLSIQALSGISFVAGYGTYYMQLAGYSTSMSFKLQITQQVVSMVGNVMAQIMIDRVGRRTLTFWGMVVLTAMLLVTGGLATVGSTGANRGTVSMILIYCWWYNVTIGATAWSILTEVSTARLRVKTIAIGLALQNALFTMWSFVLPYLFNPNAANLQAKVSFIYGGLAVLCCIYLYFYQPETSGRSYEELDEMFVKKIPARKFKDYVTSTEIAGQDTKRAQSTVGSATGFQR